MKKMNVWKYWSGASSSNKERSNDPLAPASDAVIVTVATTPAFNQVSGNNPNASTNNAGSSGTSSTSPVKLKADPFNNAAVPSTSNDARRSSIAARRTTLPDNPEFDQDTRDEYERKIKVLSQCLETKAEENITLYEQLEKAKKTISKLETDANRVTLLDRLLKERDEALQQREDQVAHLAEQLATTELDKLQLQDMKEEYERRIQALSVCLEEMASENIQFWQTAPGGAGTSNAVATPSGLSASTPAAISSNASDQDSRAAGIRVPESGGAATPMQALLDEVRKTGDDRSELAMKLRAELEDTKKKLVANEKRLVQLNTKLMDAVNKKHALQESNDAYETKLKSLEKEMMENLHQEGIRRQEAEYIVSKLRKKVAELQFLLDEREQESSEEEEEEEEDSD